MKTSEVKKTIRQDKAHNQHPKNRWFIFIYRWGQYYYLVSQENKLFLPIYTILHVLMKCSINRNNHFPFQSKIGGGGIRLPHLMGIVIAGDATIGKNCTILHQVTIGVDDTKQEGWAPVIGDDVYIGAGAKVIGNVRIGDHVIIGANSVITKDIPSDATVVGFNRIINKEKKA